ncbi:U-box domain-containing protein 15-like [Glycine soja]|nr:U-box domain-containing protein 15-like [Glycine max]XP_028181470.1 U-box domain-containing protein 15-like [Glycine soja]|eukprot:XP_006588216.1 U-box domain-containing protein 15-like [Glycine max]
MDQKVGPTEILKRDTFLGNWGMLTEGSQLLKQGDYLWCVGYWQVLFVWLSFFSALQSKVTNLDLKAQDFDMDGTIGLFEELDIDQSGSVFMRNWNAKFGGHLLISLIEEWCDNNNFKLPKKYNSSHQETYPIDSKEEIPALVESLSSIHLEEQTIAMEKIHMLSKEIQENRVFVAEHGGIPPLVQLLCYPDSKIQEHAVTTLLNLSIDEGNKSLISTKGVIPTIIEVLENGSYVAKENSAVALLSLLMLDEIKDIVGQSNGFPPLVDLLRNRTITRKKDVVTAIFNLSINHATKVLHIRAGIIAPLLQLLKDPNLRMIDEAPSILLLLISNSEAREEIGQISFIETLVEFMREGSTWGECNPENLKSMKENS